MMFRRLIALCLILASVALASAQAQAGADALGKYSELERRTLALDIAVSNYYELKALCIANNIPTEGTSEDLRALLYTHFGLTAPTGPVVDSSVLIESADSLEYFTLEDTKERLVRLTGPLSVSMSTSDGFKHRITADEIVFDRDSSKVRATGNVLYARTGSGRSDEYKGESIEVDLATYSGVFVDGSFDLEPGDALQRTTTFRFDSLIRRGDTVSVFDGVKVTACDADPPHYYVKARRAWLFQNGDWALSGATLYLGVVPVLWLPFFYYPNDELLLHPILGYKSREGAFVQTSTYLIGAKAAGTTATSTLSAISRPNQGPGRTQGMFIRRDGTVKGSQDAGTSSDYLKILADIYSSLGIYAGVAGSFGDAKAGKLTFGAGIGLSRSIFLQSNGYYSPFDAAGSYASQWNTSALGSLVLPLRFGASAAYKVDKTAGKLRYSVAADLPFYSDPYFEQDFGQRSESSSILSAFDTNKTTVSKRSAMTQSLSSSLSLNMPAGDGNQGLQNLSLSRLAAQLVWKSKAQSTTGLTATQRRLLAADPQREFFYPDTLKLLDATGSMGGRLIGYEIEGKSSGSLDWTVSGSAGLDWKFRSSGWTSPETIDGSLSYFLAGWRGQGKLSWASNFLDNHLSLAAGLGISTQDQARPYLYDERSAPTTPHPFRLSDYMYRNAASEGSLSVTYSPFISSSPFAASNLQYSLGASIFKYRYLGLSGTGVDALPSYGTEWVSWDKEMIGTHSLTATFALSPKNSPSHRLSFSGYLPPLYEKYAGTYSLDYKYVKFILQGALSRDTPTDDLLPSSLGGRIVIGADPFPVLTSDMSWDFLTNAPSASSATLRYQWARLGFNAKKAKGYVFSGGTWSLDGTEYFRPYDFSVALAPKATSKTNATMKFDARSTLSYTQNIIRFTESKLSAAFDLSLVNKSGTSLTFSSSSSNRSAWRYWTGLFPVTVEFNPGDYSRSIVSDLIDSLSVWDTARLRNGLFKLESMKIKLAQDLHDWNIAASLGMDPVLITPDSGRSYYQLDFSFTFAVTWKDIPEIKTSLSYDQGVFGD
jgi:lipopolysaccharide assembly outer membrane protein LptD (OstA)